jgi:hypothetical protein
VIDRTIEPMRLMSPTQRQPTAIANTTSRRVAFVNENRRCHRPVGGDIGGPESIHKAGDRDRTGDIQLGKLTFYR